MKNLLTAMLGKAEVDTEGAHRQLVCALNGLAAIHCIKNEVSCLSLCMKDLLTAMLGKAEVDT